MATLCGTGSQSIQNSPKRAVENEHIGLCACRVLRNVIPPTVRVGPLESAPSGLSYSVVIAPRS